MALPWRVGRVMPRVMAGVRRPRGGAVLGWPQRRMLSAATTVSWDRVDAAAGLSVAGCGGRPGSIRRPLSGDTPWGCFQTRGLLAHEADRHYDVLTVSKDGTRQNRRMSLAAFRAECGVLARDVLAVDADSAKATPSILPRRHCVVLTVSHIRMLLLSDTVIFFSLDRPGARGFAEEVGDYLQRHPTACDHYPFEFLVLELALASVHDKYEKRVKFCSPIVRTLLRSMRVSATRLPDEQRLHRLYPLNASVSAFAGASTQFLKSIRQVLSDDDEMMRMCLSASKPADHPDGDAYSPPTEQMEELEELLQLYHRKMTGIRSDCESLLNSISSAQQIVNLQLDNYRNHLISFNLRLAMITAGLGIGTFVAGSFGMNLYSGLEEVPVLFYAVTGTSVAGGFAFFKWCQNFAQRTAPSGESVNAISRLAERIDEIASTIDGLDMGDPISKDEFQALHPDMTNEEVRLVFQAFDGNKDGELGYQEYIAAVEAERRRNGAPIMHVD